MILMEFLEEPMNFIKTLKQAYEVNLMNVIGYFQNCDYTVLYYGYIFLLIPNYDESLEN